MVGVDENEWLGDDDPRWRFQTGDDGWILSRNLSRGVALLDLIAVDCVQHR